MKNSGIKNTSCRELGDLVVGRDGGLYAPEVYRPSPVGCNPALSEQPAIAFSQDLRDASLRVNDPLCALPNWQWVLPTRHTKYDAKKTHRLLQ